MTVKESVHVDLIERYLERLAADFETTSCERGSFVLTPFDRPDGEGIEVEFDSLPGGRVCVSDMGDTLGYLYVNGLAPDNIIMDKAERIAMSYGVSIKESALVVEAASCEAGDALHRLIQAVLRVTDLIHLRSIAELNKPSFDDGAARNEPHSVKS